MDPDMSFHEVWEAAKQGGPFATLILLVAIYALNAERKAWQDKYENLVKRYLILASDINSTLKDWRDVLTKEGRSDD
jgi:hypothetical protein